MTASLACVATLISRWTENNLMSVLPQPLTMEVQFVETRANFGAAEQRAAVLDLKPCHVVMAHLENYQHYKSFGLFQ